MNEAGGVGKIVKNVNTTADVKPGEIKRQAKKMGFTTSDEGVPPTLSTSGQEVKSNNNRSEKNGRTK